jgi:hypothetical protein
MATRNGSVFETFYYKHGFGCYQYKKKRLSKFRQPLSLVGTHFMCPNLVYNYNLAVCILSIFLFFF